MGIWTDKKGQPGDFAFLRLSRPTVIWRRVPDAKGGLGNAAGTVQDGALGLIVTSKGPWTFVLWSNPLIAGWIADGFLRTTRPK